MKWITGVKTIKTVDQGIVWLVGRRQVCGRRLNLRPIGRTPAVCDINSAAAAAVCGLCRNIQVLHAFAFRLSNNYYNIVTLY